MNGTRRLGIPEGVMCYDSRRRKCMLSSVHHGQRKQNSKACRLLCIWDVQCTVTVAWALVINYVQVVFTWNVSMTYLNILWRDNVYNWRQDGLSKHSNNQRNVDKIQTFRFVPWSMVVSRTVRSTIGDRTFLATAASVWNSLPESVRSSPSLQVFRSRLKTELFAWSYSHD